MLGLAGTKSWTGGITLTSSGLRDLDAILGGAGQPLGTCILVEEDRWTQSLASTLVRYWSAEAVAHGHHLVIPTMETNTASDDGFDSDDTTTACGSGGPSPEWVVEFLHSLPWNLHWEKQQKVASGEVNESSAGLLLLDTLEEEEGDESNEEGLKIAWQYRKNVQQQRLGMDTSTVSTSSSKSSDVYCHSYDLSRQLSAQMQRQRGFPIEQAATFQPAHCCDNNSSCSGGRSCGVRLYKSLLQQLDAAMAEKPKRVIRLLLVHHTMEPLSIALPLLLVQIRMRQLPVVVLVCQQPWKSYSHNSDSACRIHLHRCSDVVLQTEGFAARTIHPPPPEFRHLHGLLLVRKVSTATAPTAIGGGHCVDLTITKRPPANIYGLKRDRRKLHIPLLHIPPEDHTGGGGSVGGGAARSGAGRPVTSSSGGGGCSSGTTNSLLSF